MGKKERTEGRSVLVTGGAGFIASHVAEGYLERGWSVTIVDDLSSGKKENLPADAYFVEMDICDDRLIDLFRERGGFDLVNHHAAQIDVRTSVSKPVLDARINVLGLLNVLQGALEYGTRRVVFVSSGGVVYGDASERPIPETATKQPESPYGVSKLAGEYYLRALGGLHGLEYVALRYSNVYGPRQDPHGEAGVVAIFSRCLMEGRPITIFGDGEQTRDYVYVGDVVRANMVVSEAEIGGERRIDDPAFNVATGRETSVNELAAVMMETTGRQVPIERAPARRGELLWNSLRCDKLKNLGWGVEVDLKEGLARTYRSIAGIEA